MFSCNKKTKILINLCIKFNIINKILKIMLNFFYLIMKIFFSHQFFEGLQTMKIISNKWSLRKSVGYIRIHFLYEFI